MAIKKKILIGTSGWNYKHWKGIFYPIDLPQKDWFNYYTQYFNITEINYSFYRWPDQETILKWQKKYISFLTTTPKGMRSKTLWL